MDYKARLQRFQQRLSELACDAFMVENKTDLYYLTGLELSAGCLLIHTNGAHLFVDNRYTEICEKNSPFPVMTTGLVSFESYLTQKPFSYIKRLAIDAENMSYKGFSHLKKLLQGNSSIEVVPMESPTKKLRSIKDPLEVKRLKESAALGYAGYKYISTLIHEGISEEDLAIELEIFWKKKGGRSPAFDPIIAFGANSSMPHYRAGSVKLVENQNVLIDIGVNFHHYQSDLTRVAFFGNPPQILFKIHEIVQAAQRAALALCRPGTTLGELDAAARNYISSHGYGENFTHSLGHGIGLDVHEFPTIKQTPPFQDVVLVPGMAITIEPGIYLPGIGGIRIEDSIIITENGHENLVLVCD